MAETTVFVRFRKRVQHPRGQPIRLGQVAQLLVQTETESTAGLTASDERKMLLRGVRPASHSPSDPNPIQPLSRARSPQEAALEQLVLFEPKEHDGNLVLIEIMSVIEAIHRQQPDARVELFGEPHALVELVTAGRKPWLLLVLPVWLLLFIGSGLAIMNFHADVSMPEVHRRIYELITGQRSDHPYWLQIPYSIGIGAGMVLFFNHLFKRKFNDEPSPLEVEMFLYQENLNQYAVMEEYAKLQRRKAGKHGGGGGG